VINPQQLQDAVPMGGPASEPQTPLSHADFLKKMEAARG